MVVGAGEEPTTGCGRADDTDSAPLKLIAKEAAARKSAADSDSWSKVTGLPLLESAVAGAINTRTPYNNLSASSK
jgi:hypothetical protein